MAEPRKPHLPIGYWIKRADALLTARINEAQAANGLTRTEWQVLNSVFEMSSAAASEIAEVLRPFADPLELSATIDGLVRRGLIAEGAGEPGRLRLTPAGEGTARSCQGGSDARAAAGGTGDHRSRVRDGRPGAPADRRQFERRRGRMTAVGVEGAAS